MLGILIALLLLTSFNFKSVSGKVNDEYWAKSYIVMEQQSKQIIMEKNSTYCQSVASISKIMTAIIAIESNKLNDIVVVGKEIKSIYGSQVYLKLNDKISLLELVYGLLLRSGNDCAVVIATYLCGTIDNFVKIMNDKANKLGMKSTTFNNPHGLDEQDGGNISNCRDMAILKSYCLNNEIYREISASKTYKTLNYGVWNNKNKLLNQYEFTTSGKTGYTVNAKRTLITSAKKGNTEFIVVTFDCSNDFIFHKNLYEKVFEEYERRLILEEGTNYVDEYEFTVKEDVYYFQKSNDWKNTKLLFEIDETNRVIEVYIIKNGKGKYFVGEYQIVAEEENKSLMDRIKEFFNNLF